MTGTRYPLSGQPMPHLVPFIEQVLGMPIDVSDAAPDLASAVPSPHVDPALMERLVRRLTPERVSIDPSVRLTHSHGQLSVGEVDRVLQGRGLPRVVDVVVEPADEEDVAAIVRAGTEHGACLVPYGGGTNVSGALACPASESRTVISIDMRRLCHVRSVDLLNGSAVVEAGITGAALEEALAKHGAVCGHTPDSFEFSTLGGWIATNASGMKKNRYGNIEDIVLEATLVTPAGVVETRRPVSRASTGVQPLSLVFGSEGNFGVITKARIAIHPAPEACRYGSFVFRSFDDGLSFLRAVRAEGVLPASIRLVDTNEFRFGQALRPEVTGVHGWLASVKRRWLLDVLRFDPSTLAACTLVMEGRSEHVVRESRALRRLAKRFGGVWGGATNGRRGYSLTFAIAYLRDFVGQFGVIAESFETSVPWDRVTDVCGAVRQAVARECASRGVPGTPYLSYRVTQTYHTGVCVYFTLAFATRGLARAGEVFQEIELRLRQVILDHGGSLSHHHGVGKIRQRFLTQVYSPAAIDVIGAAKRAMDPDNVFGIGNGACGG